MNELSLRKTGKYWNVFKGNRCIYKSKKKLKAFAIYEGHLKLENNKIDRRDKNYFGSFTF